MRLIDADALYKNVCDLEAQAIDYTVKISNDEEKREEWLRWSAILAERTAFKHDVYDAPTIEPERKTGRWLQISPARIYECSECAQMVMTDDISCYKYCHGCGAYMGGDDE